MGYFPGNIMVIDDKFDLVYHGEPEDPSDRVQYKSLIDVKNFAENNGIPLISITETDDTTELQKTINHYNNVRLLVLDLDLNNDGIVSETDDYLTVRLIIRTAVKKYGYFILMINSAHLNEWKNIAKDIREDINSNLFDHLTYTFNKASDENAYDSLKTIESNYSSEMIYHFEASLNEARDKAFNQYFDFETNSWEKIYLTLKHETGLMAHNEISNILLSTVKHFLINSKYKEPEEDENPAEDPKIKQLVFETINYTRNNNRQLEEQPIWTGNLYATNISEEGRKFALVITPECDIAQGKNLFYKVVYGFEINEQTLPEKYDDKDGEPFPLFFQRAKRMTKNKLEKEYVNINKALNQYLYLLKYISSKWIFIDFRDVRSHENVDLEKWKLLLRINEPLITDILDKYSNLHNRKGLVSF